MTPKITIDEAVSEIKTRLQEDPRIEKVGDQTGPRDYLFNRKVVEWIGKLEGKPSDALILAAWGHNLDRWKLPRNTQPMTTTGYHKWRRAHAKLSAEETGKIVAKIGDEKLSAEVMDLILKKSFPDSRDSRILEDADCIAFVETKLENYLGDWDEEKTIRILKKTLDKMTPPAIEFVLKLPLPDRVRSLLVSL